MPLLSFFRIKHCVAGHFFLNSNSKTRLSSDYDFLTKKSFRRNYVESFLSNYIRLFYIFKYSFKSYLSSYISYRRHNALILILITLIPPGKLTVCYHYTKDKVTKTSC